MTATQPDTDVPQLELLAQGAAAAAGALPTTDPVTAAAPQPGDDQVTAVFARALAAETSGRGGREGRVALLLGEELVRVLDARPGTDAATVFKAALDALGASLGIEVGPAQEIGPADVPAVLGAAWSVVPLIGEGFAGAVATSDALLLPTPAYAAPSAPDVFAAPAATPAASATRTPTAAPDVAAPHAAGRPAPAINRGIDMLHDIDLEITVELGRTRLLVRDLLTLAPGDVIELDRAAGSPADLLVSGRLIARGEVVVVDEDFGLRITQIIEPSAS